MVKSWYDIIVANAALLKIYTTTSIAPDAEVMTRQKVLEKKKLQEIDQLHKNPGPVSLSSN